MNNDRYPLRQVILDDLLSHNKVALLLLIAVLGSATATIWITHHTRLLISEQGKLTDSIQKLENEYAELQLQENVNSRKDKLDGVLNRAGYQPLTKEQEIILEER